MERPRILSIGSINLDVQVRAAGWPAKGAAAMASDCLLVSGGKGANVAYLAQLLGAEAQLVARVGDDPTVPRLLAPLEDLGVDLSEVRRTHHCLSGVSMIMTPPDGKKSILLAPNANREWTEEDGAHLSARVAGAPQGSVIVVDFEISPWLAARLITAADQAGHRVLLDPAPPQDVPQQVFAHVDCTTPDASEAEALTGIEVQDAESGLAAAESLHRLGAKNVLVKIGREGCAVLGSGVAAQVKPELVEAVDATGAGDAFAAALAVALLEGQPLLEAARWAVAASTIAVTRYGSQSAYPTRRQLEEQLASVRVLPR